MRTRRTDILVGITVAVTLLAAGCGGGGSKAATGSPNGVNPGVELPAIQVQHQSAFALLDAAGWSAALGDGVTAIEDDLMAPDSSCGGSISGASTLTAGDIKIVIVLYACDSEADAQSLASAIGSPAPQVTVQQCTQLLNVRPELGPESQQVLNHIKENGGDPTVAAKEANATLAAAGTKLADALKAKLSCDPGKSVFEIPAGGADPCDSASLSAAVGEAGTGRVVPSAAEDEDGFHHDADLRRAVEEGRSADGKQRGIRDRGPQRGVTSEVRERGRGRGVRDARLLPSKAPAQWDGLRPQDRNGGLDHRAR